MRLPVPTEREEQKALFAWAAQMAPVYPDLAWLFHIPNSGGYSGTFKQNVARVAGMTAQGVKTGVPDICLPIARKGFHGLYGEMKRRRGSRFPPEQRKWCERLIAEGYLVRVWPGWDAARADLCHYLSIEETR
jgi:hypothetical protein